MIVTCLAAAALLLAAAGTPNQAAAQPPAGAAASQEASPQPRAVISDTIVDFGLMPRGETAERAITLENRGNAPLEITHVRNNCACTLLEWPKRVMPGEKAELKLHLDTETLDGVAQAITSLYTNDPTAARIDITTKIESRPYVFAEPPEFRFIVHRFFESAGVATSRIAAAEPADFRITGIESPSPFLHLTYRESRPEERLKASTGTQYVIEAKLDPEAPVGPLSGWVRVSTDHEKQKKLSISLSGFVRPLLHITPSEADLGTVDFAEGDRWSYHLKNFAAEAIQIERTETDVKGLTVEIRPGDNDHEFYVLLILAKDAPKGPIQGKVTLFTTSPKVPRLELPVRGTNP